MSTGPIIPGYYGPPGYGRAYDNGYDTNIDENRDYSSYPDYERNYNISTVNYY